MCLQGKLKDQGSLRERCVYMRVRVSAGGPGVGMGGEFGCVSASVCM